MSESKNKHPYGLKSPMINFMKQRFVAVAFSLLLLLGSLASLAINGLQFGLDFTGGLQVEAQFDEPANLAKVRETLEANGFKNVVAVNFGSDKDVKITTQQDRAELITAQLSILVDSLSAENILVKQVDNRTDERLPNGGLIIDIVSNSQEVLTNIDTALSSLGLAGYSLTDIEDDKFSVLSADGVQVVAEKLTKRTLESSTDSGVIIKRTEFVGPQVGDELRDQGGLGLLFALAVVMVYVALRFQIKFSVGAVAALAHDVIIVVGFFSLFKLDFDLTVLAAVLAVIGYSLNDTIVVCDRIRENFRKLRNAGPIDIINVSLTQTLGRTLVTSLTTLLVLLALFFFGGELIHAFSVALIIGVVIGTYSSVYVAANVLLFMHITKEDLITPEKEGAELDGMP